MPDNPRKTAPQNEPDAIERFKCSAQRLIKGTWHHRKGFIQANILFGGKELPTNVDHVLPPLLSQWTTKEPMFQ